MINALLGLSFETAPAFAKAYGQVAEVIAKALSDYSEDVRAGAFPSEGP